MDALQQQQIYPYLIIKNNKFGKNIDYTTQQIQGKNY